jgi:hypothetical protein
MEMGHNLYSAPKYRPSAHTHLQRRPCPGWKHLWKPYFGLTVDLLSRSVEFRLRMKNDDLWALFTVAVLTYAVFACTDQRREISPAVFSRVQLEREYIQNQPPVPRHPGELGKLFTP